MILTRRLGQVINIDKRNIFALTPQQNMIVCAIRVHAATQGAIVRHSAFDNQGRHKPHEAVTLGYHCRSAADSIRSFCLAVQSVITQKTCALVGLIPSAHTLNNSIDPNQTIIERVEVLVP